MSRVEYRSAWSGVGRCGAWKSMRNNSNRNISVGRNVIEGESEWSGLWKGGKWFLCVPTSRVISHSSGFTFIAFRESPRLRVTGEYNSFSTWGTVICVIAVIAEAKRVPKSLLFAFFISFMPIQMVGIVLYCGSCSLCDFVLTFSRWVVTLSKARHNLPDITTIT